MDQNIGGRHVREVDGFSGRYKKLLLLAKGLNTCESGRIQLLEGQIVDLIELNRKAKQGPSD